MKAIINFLRSLYQVENRTVSRFRGKMFVALFALSLTSCTHKPSKFVGYVVCMEYYPQRMSNETERVEQYAGFMHFHRPIIVNRADHRGQVIHTITEGKYIIYVANKDKVKSFEVDSAQFNSTGLGHKIIITQD